jgi:hypothetical protein
MREFQSVSAQNLSAKDFFSVLQFADLLSQSSIFYYIILPAGT